jgi:uncharacterized protein YbjT (DUF2867 family)
VHAQAAEKIAKEAAKEGAKVMVQISALGVDKAKRSSYARSKLQGEKAVMAAFKEATIIRPSILFGPEDNFFNKFARMRRFSPALPAIGGGQTLFQPAYVDDVARAIVAVVENAKTAGKVYELGGPKTYRFRELLAYVAHQIGREDCQISMPFALSKLMAIGFKLLPCAPITADQVQLLKTDNCVSDGALGFKELGIEPVSVESVVPTYLVTYRTQAA